ncbi:translocation and assembly module TamA [Sphingomonas sp. UYP23]
MSLSVGRRRAYRAAAGILWCVGSGAVAQTRPAGAPVAAPVESPADPLPQTSLPLDPQSPLAPLPGLGVDWPDLSKAPQEPVTANTPTAMTGETRYSYRIDGIDDVASTLLRDRFAQLSTLRANDGQPANAAQLDRRAREDATLLTTLLRGEGYYDARVATRVEPAAWPLVVLDAEPGTLYTFGGVNVAGIDAAGDKAPALRKAFGLDPGDAVNVDAVLAAETSLRTTISDRGFPFAIVGDPQIVVDRAAHTAMLDLAVVPGGARRFGAITMTSGSKVFDADHVQDIARFVPGQSFDASALADVRRALVQTSLVSSVKITPVEGKEPGTVDIAVGLEPAPKHTIAGELGYGTGEGARAALSWTNRNLFPPEGALTLAGVLGTQEQSASVTFRRNNFNGRDRILTFQTVASNVKRTAYQARTVSLSGSLERQTNIFFQKKWTWSLGAELVASDERDVLIDTGAPRRRTYFIGALPTVLSYDGSNDLLDPTRGFRLSGRFSHLKSRSRAKPSAMRGCNSMRARTRASQRVPSSRAGSGSARLRARRAMRSRRRGASMPAAARRCAAMAIRISARAIPITIRSAAAVSPNSRSRRA